MKKKIPVDPRADLVDELGELQARIAPLAERAKVVRAELAATFAGKPPETAFHVWGKHFELTVSACRKVRSITNMLKVFKFLGTEKFLGLCSFPLSAIDEHLTLPERAAVLTEGRTGSREMTVTPLAKAEAVAA